jgi:hypothetical protein
MNARTVQSRFDAIRFAVSRTVSQFLKASNEVLGALVNRVLSSRVQFALFISVTRCNALVVVFGAASLLGVVCSLYPYSELAVVTMVFVALLSMGTWLRLERNASYLVSSVYGRQLRIHLPDTYLTPRDVASFKRQTERLIRIAQLTRIKILHFDSPLLVAESTCRHLLRYLKSGASLHGANITIDVHNPREVDEVAQGSLSLHEERYGMLRSGRIATGANGRLLTRKVLVRLRRD